MISGSNLLKLLDFEMSF